MGVTSPPRFFQTYTSGKCAFCNKYIEIDKRVCSNLCLHEWLIRSNPSYMRRQIHNRDKGICSLCFADTDKMCRIFNLLDDDITWPLSPRNLLSKHWGIHHARQTFWDVDHIVAVVNGGGACGLENLRTLCASCHAKETHYLRQDIEIKKRIKTTGQAELAF